MQSLYRQEKLWKKKMYIILLLKKIFFYQFEIVAQTIWEVFQLCLVIVWA